MELEQGCIGESRLRPARESSRTALDTLTLPWIERLKLRPWESQIARMKLRVPPKLLPSNCVMRTSWIVLTGATCAGKTTTIKELQRRGKEVLNECAGTYTQEEERKGRTVYDIRKNDLEYRLAVFRYTSAQEHRRLHHAHRIIYLDRACLDSISFHRASGYDPHEILDLVDPYRYALIFHLTRLPFVDNGYRTANEDRRAFLDFALERDYRALGYEPIRVPYGTVQQRAEFIISHSAIALGRYGGN
jgi:predicted ATPase